MKFKPQISLDAGTCIFGALCILMLPLRWNLGVLLAAAVHEIFHLLTIQMTGASVTYLQMTPHGAVIGTGSMTRLQELLSSAAGPVGSFLLLIFVHRFPELALCGTIQGLFNLLPIYPFDGGRILRCLLTVFPKRVQEIIEICVLVVVHLLLLGVALAACCLFPRWRLWFIGAYILILLAAFRKIPCKDVVAGVQ
jgi:Zn-dependent protease